jgi:hypothetical protein
MEEVINVNLHSVCVEKYEGNRPLSKPDHRWKDKITRRSGKTYYAYFPLNVDI